MSDTPQGEGWWQANDGKWYAPDLSALPDPPKVDGSKNHQPGWWWSSKDKLYYPPGATSPSGQTSPFNSEQTKSNSHAGWIVAFAVLGCLIGLWSCVASAGESTSTTYSVASSEYEVENPASVRVFVEVENTGDELGTPTCKVDASDPSGAYSGFGTFEMETPIQPGETGRFNGSVVITDQGAAFVSDVTVECEA